MKLCLQMGHVGRNSGSTGAPGEQELNKRITDRLANILRSKGFEIKQTDAFADTDIEVTSTDWDLFLALHGDADIYGTGGGLVDFPEPSTDGATEESQRIAKCIAEEYFHHSEIVSHPERSNANTRYYYMWQYLTLKTPCVLVEMGVVQDAHDKVLLADTDRIANALARGVCKAFNIPFDTTTTSSTSSTSSTTTVSTTITTLTTQPVSCEEKLQRIKDILYGKGFIWSKHKKIKEILPK